MDSIMVISIIFVVFILGIMCFIIYKEINRKRADKENKELFVNNSAQIKKGQSLDEVLELLGQPTFYSEVDNKYVVKWEQTEETTFSSITRSITVVVNKAEKVIDVHRENME